MENFNDVVSNSHEDDNEITIDIGRIAVELKKYWKFLVSMTAAFGLTALLISNFLMTPMYESCAKVYLKPEMRQESTGIDSSSINANSMMVNNYMAMMKGDTLLSNVADEVEHKYGLAYSGKEDNKDKKSDEDHEITKNFIKECFVTSNEPDTEIINLRAVTPDPYLSQVIVETVLKDFSAQVTTELGVKNILVIDSASYNDEKVSPSIQKNTLLGAIAGLVMALAIVALRVIFDKRLRNKEEAESYLGIPVLSTIPYREI